MKHINNILRSDHEDDEKEARLAYTIARDFFSSSKTPLKLIAQILANLI
jgi:hypothetical protein